VSLIDTAGRLSSWLCPLNRPMQLVAAWEGSMLACAESPRWPLGRPDEHGRHPHEPGAQRAKPPSQRVCTTRASQLYLLNRIQSQQTREPGVMHAKSPLVTPSRFFTPNSNRHASPAFHTLCIPSPRQCTKSERPISSPLIAPQHAQSCTCACACACACTCVFTRYAIKTKRENNTSMKSVLNKSFLEGPL